MASSDPKIRELLIPGSLVQPRDDVHGTLDLGFDEAGRRISVEIYNASLVQLDGNVIDGSEEQGFATLVEAVRGQSVRAAWWHEAGELRVVLRNGSVLRGDPADTYEGWVVFTNDQTWLVCMFGGEVAEFPPFDP